MRKVFFTDHRNIRGSPRIMYIYIYIYTCLHTHIYIYNDNDDNNNDDNHNNDNKGMLVAWLLHPAAVRCDMVLHQAFRARRVRDAGVGGKVRHVVTSGASCETSLNKHGNTSPPQGVISDRRFVSLCANHLHLE